VKLPWKKQEKRSGLSIGLILNDAPRCNAGYFRLVAVIFMIYQIFILCREGLHWKFAWNVDPSRCHSNTMASCQGQPPQKVDQLNPAIVRSKRKSGCINMPEPLFPSRVILVFSPRRRHTISSIHPNRDFSSEVLMLSSLHV